jgi:hypothetical protein
VSDDETPTWRYLVPGLLFLALAGYMLINGEIAVDKQRTMMITRAANPLIYWPSVLVTGIIGVLALRKVWQELRS